MEETTPYNAGGRPKKAPSEKRSEKMQTHFTPGEFQEVELKATMAGMNNSQFLRALALDFEITAQSNPEELKKIRAELGKIGGNINQIARQVNSGKEFDEARFKKMAVWLSKTIDQL